MITSHLLLAICWIIYCAGHSVLAATAIKKLFVRMMNVSESRYRLLYNITALAGLFILLSLQLSIRTVRLFKTGTYTNCTAMILSVAGLAIMVICIFKYFGQMNGTAAASKKQKLEISGIHRYMRHPLYSGTFLFLTGLFLFFPSMANLIAVTIIIVYTLIGIRFEEKKLIHRFGKSYKTYQKNTAMIVPFFTAKPGRR